MSIEHYHTAQLNESTLHAAQQPESDLGVVLVAFEPDQEPASLDDAQLVKVQALEQRAGKVLLAYSPEHEQKHRDA
jgi:hypothetical protein